MQSLDEPTLMRKICLTAGVLALVAFSFSEVAGDSHEARVAGVIVAVEENVVVVITADRLVKLDMSRFCGVTVAVTLRDEIAAVGALNAGGDTLFALRLEVPRSP